MSKGCVRSNIEGKGWLGSKRLANSEAWKVDRLIGLANQIVRK